jgi:hypothetical protein
MKNVHKTVGQVPRGNMSDEALHGPDGTYCSPSCGRGCTAVEYLLAQTRGAELVRRLGVGWQPRIWENLGWHHGAESLDGWWNVSESRYRDHTTYTAFLHHAAHGGPGGRWAESGDTPQEAILNTMAVAQEEGDAIAACMKGGHLCADRITG